MFSSVIYGHLSCKIPQYSVLILLFFCTLHLVSVPWTCHHHYTLPKNSKGLRKSQLSHFSIDNFQQQPFVIIQPSDQQLIFCRLAKDDHLYNQHFWWKVTVTMYHSSCKDIVSFPMQNVIQMIRNIGWVVTNHCM